MEDEINAYTEEALEEWEENDEIAPWEAAFIRGANSAYEEMEEEEAEEGT